MIDVYIGVGSNINPEENIHIALTSILETVTITGISTFYWTEPIANCPQEDYLNGVWRVNTSHSPVQLKFDVLQAIEEKLMRRRTDDRYAPRTIDLDLILYGNQIIHMDSLTIPDPDIYHRPFIALPLYELDSDMVLPDTNTPLSHIAGTFSDANLTPDIIFTNKLKRLLF